MEYRVVNGPIRTICVNTFDTVLEVKQRIRVIEDIDEDIELMFDGGSLPDGLMINLWKIEHQSDVLEVRIATVDDKFVISKTLVSRTFPSPPLSPLSSSSASNESDEDEEETPSNWIHRIIYLALGICIVFALLVSQISPDSTGSSGYKNIAVKVVPRDVTGSIDFEFNDKFVPNQVVQRFETLQPTDI